MWILRFYFYLAVYKSQQGEFKGKENNTKQDQLLLYLVFSTLDEEDLFPPSNVYGKDNPDSNIMSAQLRPTSGT